MKQRSQEWLDIRKEKPTASQFGILMAPRGLGQTAITYAEQLVSDSMQNYFEDIFQTQAMRDGIENEPVAIDKYEKKNLEIVKEVGFIQIKIDKYENEFVGCSPDGLVGKEGGVEIKCPGTKKHIKNLISDVCPKEYYDQIQGCMFVTNRKWWDLVSYNPMFKPKYQLKVIRIEADIVWQEKFTERLHEFIKIKQNIKSKLNN